jgi:peptidoglycan/LPS O-acetylase OafA/YrhL
MTINSSAINFINCSRWLAAFLVLIHHVRHIVFADYRDVIHRGLLIKGFYFLTGLGHESVVVFFVLSGFLVGGLSVQRTVSADFKLIPYFSHRFARIYTVLIPALLIGGILDYFGSRYLDGAHLYSNSPLYHTTTLNYVIKDRINIKTFLDNIFMLQESVVPTFGSNGPLWSLADEWWYYMIFAAVMVFIFYKSKVVKVACVCAILILFGLLSYSVLLWLGVWALGVVSWYYWKSPLPKPRPLVALLVFVGALALSRLSHSSESTEADNLLLSFRRDLVLGVGYSVLLASMLAREGKSFYASANKKLADFSFSLYLYHFPAMIFVVALCESLFNISFLLQPSLDALAYGILMTILLLFYAIGLYRLTEAHTDRIRSSVEASLVAARYRLLRLRSSGATPLSKVHAMIPANGGDAMGLEMVPEIIERPNKAS